MSIEFQKEQTLKKIMDFYTLELWHTPKLEIQPLLFSKLRFRKKQLQHQIPYNIKFL